MYAVVCTGGKQYRVAPGDTLRVERINNDAGETIGKGAEIELTDVRLLSTDDGLVTDPAKLEAAKVLATVQDEGRGKKLRVFKYKRRKNYRRHVGHRQSYTELRIRDIQA